MNRIGVFGANGRMGLALLEAATIKEQTQLGGAYVRSSSSLLGINVNQVNSAADKAISFSYESKVADVDVLIDFTLPAGMRNHLKTALDKKLPMVIGTTGLTSEDMALLENAAKHIPIVFARNYSVGVNVLLNLVQTAATKFGDDLDYIRRMNPWLDITILALSVRNTLAAQWDRRSGKPSAMRVTAAQPTEDAIQGLQSATRAEADSDGNS